ncbi:hypothetical protein T484DRAFT_1823625 [Baffinella frigidus]|nr:hypothetical protein T484DRAFT_1823625 [Cryptophyta sp. CCMP2293]
MELMRARDESGLWALAGQHFKCESLRRLVCSPSPSDSRPRPLSAIMFLLRMLNIDHQPFFVWLLLCRKPSGALLSVMLSRFEEPRPRDNAQAGRRMLQLLNLHNPPADSLEGRRSKLMWVPGLQAAAHSFWVFPVLVSNSRVLLRKLRLAGVDASSGSTQICIVRCRSPLPPGS